jgi:hypothetical protein
MSQRTLAVADGSMNRGRLMTAAQIRSDIFAGNVSEWWIRKNVAPDAKLTLGRSTVFWYERDVYRWINDQRGQ